MSRYLYSGRKVLITLRYVTLRYVHYIKLRCVAFYCVTLRYVKFHIITLHYGTLHYHSSNFAVGSFSSQGFFLSHKMHPQVSIWVESALYFSSKLWFLLIALWEYSYDCCWLFRIIFFCFSIISLSQGSRSTGGHSWRCRRSTGCGSSFAPYLETARYYPGMCWLRVIGGRGVGWGRQLSTHQHLKLFLQLVCNAQTWGKSFIFKGFWNSSLITVVFWYCRTDENLRSLRKRDRMLSGIR